MTRTILAAPFATPLMAALLATAAFAPAAHAAPTDYPLSIDNCGYAFTLDGPPENVVSIGQATTEILYALGAEENMAGTALWFNDVLPEYAGVNDGIERISDNMPSFESVVNKRPGLVPTMFEWMIGEQGVVGTREQFDDLGIPTYVMPSDCEGKDNLVGADGTRTASFDIETLYQSIDELARMFDRQDRGAEVIADLRAREAEAVAGARDLGLEDASAVVWFSSADMALDPYVAGQKGIPAWMMDALGLRNVITSDEEWPTVGWESIAKADPSVIVLARMDRRRFPADDYEEKLKFLKSDPVTQHMTAVQQDRIVILDAEAMHASIRLIDGLETLTEAMTTLAQ